MLSKRLLARVLGVDAKTVRVEQAELVDDCVQIRLRPRIVHRWRCPHCENRCPHYDQGRTRRWRALDWWRTRVFVVAQVPRVQCAEHGVVVAAVPWVRHGARHTIAFEQVAAWCAVEMSATAASRLLRCTWRTVGSIVARVVAELDGDALLEGVRRIGIDEISYRRHRRYLLVVVDHDQRRLIHCVDGANRRTLESFFDQLGKRTSLITHVSADGAPWITKVVTERCPTATLCADIFHVVQWATEALDVVRRDTWNEVSERRRRGHYGTGEGKVLKDARWSLWKNPDHLSESEQARLDHIAATHPRLHRAWALKEGLRVAVTGVGPEAVAALDRWTQWAQRSRIPSFVTLARRIRNYRSAIVATITHRLTNALVESFNTKIRLIARRAFGFHNVAALIALARLTLSGQRPTLPT
ncbi:MAG: ISL3 family transposase [Acidobacteria bacterium]|nr:ISL3 family transposase [Acidobacteriota bacterium]